MSEPDFDPVAVGMGTVAVVGVVAAVVGATMIAARYGGVWAGVAVAGVCVFAASVVGLFAYGQAKNENGSGGRFR